MGVQEQESGVCSICEENMVRETFVRGADKTECGHGFCFRCIKREANRDGKCPICEARISQLFVKCDYVLPARVQVDDEASPEEGQYFPEEEVEEEEEEEEGEEEEDNKVKDPTYCGTTTSSNTPPQGPHRRSRRLANEGPEMQALEREPRNPAAKRCREDGNNDLSEEKEHLTDEEKNNMQNTTLPKKYCKDDSAITLKSSEKLLHPPVLTSNESGNKKTMNILDKEKEEDHVPNSEHNETQASVANKNVQHEKIASDFITILPQLEKAHQEQEKSPFAEKEQNKDDEEYAPSLNDDHQDTNKTKKREREEVERTKTYQRCSTDKKIKKIATEKEREDIIDDTLNTSPEQETDKEEEPSLIDAVEETPETTKEHVFYSEVLKKVQNQTLHNVHGESKDALDKVQRVTLLQEYDQEVISEALKSAALKGAKTLKADYIKIRAWNVHYLNTCKEKPLKEIAKDMEVDERTAKRDNQIYKLIEDMPMLRFYTGSMSKLSKMATS